MARRSSAKRGGVSKGGKSSRGQASAAPGAKIKKINSYEDTLEPGGVDDHIFKRDQIFFNPQDESDDDDINADQGEEVLALKIPAGRRPAREAIDGDDEDEDDEADEDDGRGAKGKKEYKRSAKEISTKGRFGKPIVSSDEEDEAEGSGSGSEDGQEGWGRQYYSRPSTRRERETDEYDEQREEDREMEEREVKRLQRKAREAIGGAEDWGLEDNGDVGDLPPMLEEEQSSVHVPPPVTSDPAALIRHMEAYEPVKLALARDFPLTVKKLEKTAKGIKKMEESENTDLHKGLGWLHYQTLLTYATTLSFYIHLCSLPPAERPDLSSHPIMHRLLELKQGLSMLEDLDFDAASVSDGGVVLTQAGEAEDEDEEELLELVRAKRELFARMQAGGAMEIEDGETEEEFWNREPLEDGELADLLADAASHGPSRRSPVGAQEKKKKKKKTNKLKAKQAGPQAAKISPKSSFEPLVEPAFRSLKKTQAPIETYEDGDETLGDPSSLTDADASDKDRRRKSLQFHTSKIAATSARRSAARAQRLGGDEDVPRRDRQAARDAALRRAGPAGDGGADLGDDAEADDSTTERRKGKKNKRDVEEDDEEGYYELVKRQKKQDKASKQAAYTADEAGKLAQFDADDTASGPRALTRAIEKNRGLTPRRSKSSRNPRVKKRQAYEKAKQKVASQRAVFKGGQASLGGAYQGEKTGISMAIKSRKF